jgi:hypothetical protein
MTIRLPPLAGRFEADLTRVEPEPLLNRRVSPLEFLEQVIHDESVPLPMRLRAAIEACPYQHPKLSATLLIPPDGDFATRLERAIERTRRGTVIEHEPTRSTGFSNNPVIDKGLVRRI